MTTQLPGRPVATTASRLPRVVALVSLALALCAPALSAFAAPVDDGAPFPASRNSSVEAPTAQPAPIKADLNPIAPVTASAPSLSDRALLLAADLKRIDVRLLSPMTLAPLGLPDEAIGEPVDLEGNGQVKTVLQKALALLGTPYRWGGTDPDKGFDCSGLVGYVFRNALGIELPRVSRDMAKASNPGELITDRAKLAAGDLVFFGRKGRVNHVGIYVGQGQFVHAPSRGKDVTVSSLEKGYWSGRFLQARRVSASGT